MQVVWFLRSCWTVSLTLSQLFVLGALLSQSYATLATSEEKAAGPVYKLAAIRDAEGLAKKFRLPKNKEGELVIVRCSAASQPNTENVPYFCFRYQDTNDPYTVAIENAMTMLPLDPATRDGKELYAWFNFSIVFDHESDKVQIVPSLVYSRPNEITPYYSAPQRILKYKGGRGCRSNQMVWPTIRISDTGVPSIPEEQPEGDTSCERNAVRTMMKSTFIPAAFNDQPIDAFYREPFDKELAKTPDEIRSYGGRTTRRLPSGMNLPISPPTLPSPN